jgi:hypothetical protein
MKSFVTLKVISSLKLPKVFFYTLYIATIFDGHNNGKPFITMSVDLVLQVPVLDTNTVHNNCLWYGGTLNSGGPFITIVPSMEPLIHRFIPFLNASSQVSFKLFHFKELISQQEQEYKINVGNCPRLCCLHF